MSNKNNKMDRPITVQDDMAALLPFYITGRLGLRDQLRVEQWVKDSSQGQKALENAYADQRAAIDANEAIASPSGALGNLLKDIDAEPSQAWSNYVGGNMASWVMSWLNVIPSTFTWGAVAALLLLTVVQSTLLIKTETTSPYEISNGSSNSGSTRADKGVRAIIRFAPNTGIDDIGALLSSAGATIIEGPRGKNTYVILIKEDNGLSSAKNRLDSLGKRTDLVHFIVEKKN